METQERFARLVAEYGNTAELARKAGLSRSAIDYKCRGQRRVTQWDVWAVEAALASRRRMYAADELEARP